MYSQQHQIETCNKRNQTFISYIYTVDFTNSSC